MIAPSKTKLEKASLLRGLLILALPGVLWLQGCTTVTAYQPPPVTVDQVVQLQRDGLSDQDIIARMQASGTVYRLQASQLAQLREQGVSDAVIDYMQDTYLAAARREQAYMDSTGWIWWPNDYWYGGYVVGWSFEPGWSGFHHHRFRPSHFRRPAYPHRDSRHGRAPGPAPIAARGPGRRGVDRR